MAGGWEGSRVEDDAVEAGLRAGKDDGPASQHPLAPPRTFSIPVLSCRREHSYLGTSQKTK